MNELIKFQMNHLRVILFLVLCWFICSFFFSLVMQYSWSNLGCWSNQPVPPLGVVCSFVLVSAHLARIVLLSISVSGLRVSTVKKKIIGPSVEGKWMHLEMLAGTNRFLFTILSNRESNPFRKNWPSIYIQFLLCKIFYFYVYFN